MNCNYLLNDKKCGLKNHIENKKSLSLKDNQYCGVYYHGSECMYFEPEEAESNEMEFEQSFYADINDFEWVKIPKKKHFSE